jgi:hypothetical protein
MVRAVEELQGKVPKADAALGYANAADLFHRELLSQ